MEGPGVTNQLHQEEKGCAHEGVTKWKREVVGVVTASSMLPKQFLKKLYVRSPVPVYFGRNLCIYERSFSICQYFRGEKKISRENVDNSKVAVLMNLVIL